MQKHLFEFTENFNRLLSPDQGMCSGQFWMVNHLQRDDPRYIAELMFSTTKYVGALDPCERTMVVYWTKGAMGHPTILAPLGTIEFQQDQNSLLGEKVVDDILAIQRGGMTVPLVIIDGRALVHTHHEQEIRAIRGMLGALGVTVVVFEPLDQNAQLLVDSEMIGWEQAVALRGYSQHGRALDVEFDGVLIADGGGRGPSIRLTLAKLRGMGVPNLGLSTVIHYEGPRA